MNIYIYTSTLYIAHRICVYKAQIKDAYVTRLLYYRTKFLTEPINIFHTMVESDNEPIRLSYQRCSHYNSIVDPYKATIGVGLGLPSFNPGAADRALISDAVRQSEEQHIEQVNVNL